MWEAYTQFHKKYLETINPADIAVKNVLDAFVANNNFTPDQQKLLFYSATNILELEMANSVENLSARYYDSGDKIKGDDVMFPNGYSKVFDKVVGNLEFKLNS